MRAALLLLPLCLLAAGCPPAQKERGRLDPDSIAVETGTGGLLEDGRWMRVVLSARAAAGVFQGQVEITGIKSDGSTAPERFRKPFEVSLERQTIELAVLPRGWNELGLAFRGEGSPEVARKTTLNWSPESRFRILAVSDGGFSPGGLAAAAARWRQIKKSEVVVGEVRPGSLPAHFLGYDVADLVILDRTSLADADPERIEQLREWVRRGGMVAGVPGPAWTVMLPPALLELFGLKSPPRQAEGQSPRLPAGSLYSLEPAPGSTFAAKGFLLENRFGSGRAFLLAFSPRGRLLGGEDDPDGEDSTVGVAWRRVMESTGRGFRTLGSGLEPSVVSGAIQSLVGFSGFRYPPRSSVLLFVLGYLGIGFFLAGAILRRFRRLEWMYLFAFVLSVAASIGIYRFGLLSGIKSLSVDEVTVASVRSGSGTADAASMVGVSSPRHGSLEPKVQESFQEVAVPSQPPLGEASDPALRPPPPLRRQGMGMGPDELLPLRYDYSGARAGISELPLYANSTRFLRFDWPLDLGGELKAEVLKEGQPGGRAIRVSNGTRFPLTLTFVEEGSLVRLGSLGVGKSREFPLKEMEVAAEVLSGSRFNGKSREFPLEEMESLPREPSEVEAGGQPWRYSPAQTAGNEARAGWGFESVLIRTLKKQRVLIARTAAATFPDSVLGPIRKSADFLVLPLESEPEKE
jgi:hypothetical protein